MGFKLLKELARVHWNNAGYLVTHGNPTITAQQYIYAGDHQQSPQFVIGQPTIQSPGFHIPQPLDQWSSQPPSNQQQVVHRAIAASGVTRSNISTFPPEGYRVLERGADGLPISFERVATGEIYSHSELLELHDWIDMHAQICERPAVPLD